MIFARQFSRFHLMLPLVIPICLFAQSNPPSLHTNIPPESNHPLRFAVMSDSRAAIGGTEGVNEKVFRPLLELALKDSAAFILFPGDLVNGPFTDPARLERKYRSWKRIAESAGGRIPYYTGMGNHDLSVRRLPNGGRYDFMPLPGDSSSETVFARTFTNPLNGPDSAAAGMPTYRENVYSFDWGPGHFVMLNTNYYQKGKGPLAANLSGDLPGTLRPEQLRWLDNDLQQARERGQKYLFVAAHEPAFPTGGHAHDAMWWNGKRPEVIEQRDAFWKILCQHRVTAAFFGHEHNYSRALIDSAVNRGYDYPVWQIITGGGGAPVYTQDQSVPWASAVKAFYMAHHLCLVKINGEDVWLKVLTPDGEMLELVNLNNSGRQ